MLYKLRIQKRLSKQGKTQGHCLHPFMFIFLSSAEDSTFFDLQISILLNDCSVSPFGKSQRKAFQRQEMRLLTLPCRWQHHTMSLAFP